MGVEVASPRLGILLMSLVVMYDPRLWLFFLSRSDSPPPSPFAVILFLFFLVSGQTGNG